MHCLPPTVVWVLRRWLDAQANYVRLHVGGRAHLLRDTMTAMDAKLNPEVFVRVHRSAIVNSAKLRRLLR